MSNLPEIMGYESPLGEKSLFVSKWNYEVITSSDGNSLINQYMEHSSWIENAKGKKFRDADFLVYVEQPAENEISFDFTRVVLIKMSKVMRQYILETEKEERTAFLSKISREIVAEDRDLNMTEEQVLAAFALEMRYREAKDIEIGSEKYTNRELADVFLDAASDALRSFKIPEDYWNPQLKSSKYIHPDKLFDKALDTLSKLYKKLEMIQNILSPAEKIPQIKNLSKIIEAIMADIRSLMLWVRQNKTGSRMFFAYFCGLLNGTIEFLAGIGDIFLLYIRLATLDKETLLTGETRLEFLSLTEILENIADQYIKNPNFLSQQLAEASESYLETRYNSKLSRYVIAHNASEDTILTIDIVLSVVTVVKAVGKLSTKLPKFTKWMDEVLKRNGPGARRFENVLMKLTKVAYGESELSKLAIKFRKTLPQPRHNGNIAVFEYIDEAGDVLRKEFTTMEGSKDHAEIMGMKWLRENGIDDEKIVKVYSELEPCGLEGSNCKKELQSFKNAKIEYSYDYPGTKNSEVETRRNSIKERKQDLRKFVK